jgi:hypothetical protein
MEDDLNNLTIMEEDLKKIKIKNERRPKKNGRRPQKIKNGRRPQAQINLNWL